MGTLRGANLFLLSVDPDGTVLDYSDLPLPADLDVTVHGAPVSLEVVGNGGALAWLLQKMLPFATSGTVQAGWVYAATASAFTLQPDASALMRLPGIVGFAPEVQGFVPLVWRWQIAPAVFWGVDSKLRANTGPVGGHFTLYDAVVSPDGAARTPAFWGRYVGFKNGTLLQPEVDFLHSKNCKVLLIYNDTYAYKDHLSTYADGVFHATQAIDYIQGLTSPATRLNVPQDKSVWIYLNTEIGREFPILPAVFYRGWLDAMLGSVYGGAGGVYGNTDPRNDTSFTIPYCEAYNAGISFTQRDALAGCPPMQYFGNPVGRDPSALSSRRKAVAGGTPGVHRLIETVLAGESEVIYVLWEITPGPNAVWRAGNWTVRLNVTVPSHFITWNGVEIVHTDQNCNGKERLGNLDGQSVSLIPPGVKSMVVPGIAPTSGPAAGDKILLLLSFSNSKAESRSFGYTPDQLIDSPFARVGALVYANQPNKCDAFVTPPCPANVYATNTTFSPRTPDKCSAPTVIYQYATRLTIAGVPDQVDFNLVNGAGFASTW